MHEIEIKKDLFDLLAKYHRLSGPSALPKYEARIRKILGVVVYSLLLLRTLTREIE